MKKTKEEYKKMQDEIQKKINDGEYIASKHLPDSASDVDVMKYNICQKFCEIHNNGLGLKELSEIIGCDIIQAKLIIYSHYNKFTLEFLLESYQKLINSDSGKKFLKAS